MQKLMLAEEVMDSLERWEKTVTIRKGRRDIVLGDLLFESVDEHRQEIVDVRKVIYCRLGEVPPSFYRRDGFNDSGEMIEIMREFYPEINSESEVTVIDFKRKKSPPVLPG
jgi:hypothetical protein